MKLRKILAGFLAGTIAMTSSVVMSVTASATDFTGGVVLKPTYNGSNWSYYNGDYNGWQSCSVEGVTYDTTTVGELKEMCEYILMEITPTSFEAAGAAEGAAVITHGNLKIQFQYRENQADNATSTFGAETYFTALNEKVYASFDLSSVSDSYDEYKVCDITPVVGCGWGTNAELTDSDTVTMAFKAVPTIKLINYDEEVLFEADGSTEYMNTVDVTLDNTNFNEYSKLIITAESNATNSDYQYHTPGQICDGAWNSVIAVLSNIPAGSSSTTTLYTSKLNGETSIHIQSYKDWAKVTKVVLLTETVAPTTNLITIAETIENGAITVDDDLTEAAVGDKVTLKVTPDKYYKLDTLTVMGEEAVTTTDNENGTYSFKMPAAEVSVAAKFIVDTAALKTDIDAAVKSLATVTKAYTYTTADYEADLETAIKTIEFTGLTVDTSALKETKATEEATGSIAGTVTIKAGETAVTTLTANVTLDKVPTDPVDVAKEAVEAYLAKVTFDNEFHATNQAEAIKAEVAKVAPKVRVDPSFTVLAATEDAAGSVTGTIKLVADGSEPKTIEVNETIAKLPAKNLVYADNQPALEALKADGKTVLTQTATQADGKLKSQRFVQKVTMDDVKKATGVRYDFMRSDGKTCSITGDYQCYYKSVAGVQAGTDEAFLSVTMKNIPKDMIVMCTITLLYN